MVRLGLKRCLKKDWLGLPKSSEVCFLGVFSVHHAEFNDDASPTATLNANVKATCPFEPHFVWIDTGVGQFV